MKNHTPRAITLPPASDVEVRRVDGHPALIITNPADGTEQVIHFAAGHPGDACATISSMQSALRDADGQYMDAELVYEFQQAEAGVTA